MLKLKEKPKKDYHFAFLKEYFENKNKSEILHEKNIRCEEFKKSAGIP